jgi:ribosomal protein L37AE/L43A
MESKYGVEYGEDEEMKKSHIVKQIQGFWITVCTKTGEMTRADFKFEFCPACGDEIDE